MDTPKATIGDIDLTVAHDQLEAPSGVTELVEHVAAEQGFSVRDVSIVLTDHASVKALNETHLERSYETDVLAFDLRDEAGRESKELDGEIYVDLDTALERAPEFGTDYDGEVRRYVIHGVLHLMGYRDDNPNGRDEMKRLENLYLGFASS